MPVTGNLAILVALLVSACETADEPGRPPQFATTDNAVQQWRLPDRLREISGLALAPDGRLFAVTDEMAIVYEINYADGKLVSAFALQDPPLAGDFEGIAWLNGHVYLTTSDGILYSSPEGADGERVEAARTDTGLGEKCEIEGLAEESRTDHLYFVCKVGRGGGKAQILQIFEWSVADQAVVRNIALPVADIRRTLRTDDFNPSGIVLNRANHHFLIVAARQRAMVELGQDGQLIVARQFSEPGRHWQAEGIELTSSGKLLIADEGRGGKARLAVYEPRRSEESR